MFRAFAIFALTQLSLPIWAQRVQNPFLYRISTMHGNSYILGTIHTLVHTQDFQFDIKSLVKSAEVFMPEMDTDEWKLELWQKNPAAALRLYVKEIPAKKKRIDTWTAQKLTEFGFPADLSPHLADGDCTELTLPFEFDGGLPLDAQLMQVAHLSRRKIVNLDTETLRNRARMAMETCDFHRLFQTTPPKVLFEQLKKEIQSDADFYRAGVEPADDTDPEVILRNKTWIPKIEKQMVAGTVFVAVGYGHLFGPQGLLQLLEQAGYKIVRVKPDGH